MSTLTSANTNPTVPLPRIVDAPSIALLLMNERRLIVSLMCVPPSPFFVFLLAFIFPLYRIKITHIIDEKFKDQPHSFKALFFAPALRGTGLLEPRSLTQRPQSR